MIDPRLKPLFNLRSSEKTYFSRPPSNCKRARIAWDQHTKDGRRIKWMRLDQGAWAAEREDGEMYAVVFGWKKRLEAFELMESMEKSNQKVRTK